MQAEFSPKALATLREVILNTVDYERDMSRAHTVESLICMLREMRTFRTDPASLETRTRVFIAELMAEGKLDMRSDGVLLIPHAVEVPTVERFRGSWFFVSNRGIGGPFNSEGEARIGLSQLQSK